MITLPPSFRWVKPTEELRATDERYSKNRNAWVRTAKVGLPAGTLTRYRRRVSKPKAVKPSTPPAQ